MKPLILFILTLFMTMTQLQAQENLGVAILHSDQFTVKRISFPNQYKMKIGANLLLPKTMEEGKTYPALIVGHPMGAVKEQSANIYAAMMAERGFVTLAVDLSFWGDSEGQPRNSVSPDLYAETFSAAVDYLGSQAFVDPNRIGVIGICGSGGFAISAAKIDTRIKAIATVSMYNMGETARSGLHKAQTIAQRQAIIRQASQQRYTEFAGGETLYTSGCPYHINEHSSDIEREFYDFYRTPRGEFTPEGQSPLLTTHPTLTGFVKFMNFYPFNDIDLIAPRALLFITGDKAHSKEFSQKAYAKASQPKELYYVRGVGHVDLYDRVNLIPFDKIESFFNQYLK